MTHDMSPFYFGGFCGSAPAPVWAASMAGSNCGNADAAGEVEIFAVQLHGALHLEALEQLLQRDRRGRRGRRVPAR